MMVSEREERGKGGQEGIEGREERRNYYVRELAITAIANGSDYRRASLFRTQGDSKK